MAHIYRSNGSIEEVQPANKEYFSLAEMNHIVSGYIEIIYLSDEKRMVVNEEGKLRHLPYNALATGLLQIKPNPDWVAGDALVCKASEIR